MNLSQRAVEIQASPIRKLMPYSINAKKRGIHVYQLNIGQPDIETPQEMIDVYRNYDEKVLAYGPSQGLDLYRKALVRYYKKHQIELNEDEIIVTTAGSEAIIFAMMVTCNPGDEIIVPEPFYTNYNGFATMAGVKIVPLTTYAETGFALPEKDKIEAVITDKTRAIMICNPGNPTGTVYTRQQMEMLAELVKKHNLYLITDEVYREFVYEGDPAVSALSIKGIEDRVLMCDSISKRYSACGARIGCIVSRNKDIMSAILKFAQARLCPPTIDQLAAAACVDLPAEYTANILAEYDKRRNIVYEELQKIDGIVCVKPGGAFYINAKLPIEDAEDFIIWMLENFHIDNETIMAAPAEGFYATPGLGRNELRLAYVLNENDLVKAMNIFRKGLEEYIKTH
ncbi:MAG: pyridoxal phosphate-dependent aminotransferase [Candidatus Cloacimonadales bacterium]|nr:pyridoxal phosphate-dependent aminotransferase [Candidatus Cloacimonadota bacterium]MDD2650858.1 pyridoxal phosphate-dependent aminotransferase [Candidatus Cloacimonadota bacterium]MDD3501460.1 pyridoxal phosphate-dependent aminotransferase [Candidatus Cloacimonadota bacterium]MDX9978118.1 pyridoxal phosphate-dependent aminotransferase [Candidatus Cloacimonadales bacterium]